MFNSQRDTITDNRSYHIYYPLATTDYSPSSLGIDSWVTWSSRCHHRTLLVLHCLDAHLSAGTANLELCPAYLCFLEIR